jgi:hypothetical protein
LVLALAHGGAAATTVMVAGGVHLFTDRLLALAEAITAIMDFMVTTTVLVTAATDDTI